MHTVNLSIRKLSAHSITKEERIFITRFTKYVSIKFSMLPTVLQHNTMYNAWAYLGNTRSIDNLCSKANLLVLDIDHTTISLQDRFVELVEEGFAVIVATTSDNSNMYKYRILIPLDRDVTHEEYRRLIVGIKQNKLVTDMDMVSPSQIFYSYIGASVVYNTEGASLCVEDYIADKEESKAVLHDSGATKLPSSFESDYKQFFRSHPISRTKRLMHLAHRMMDEGYAYGQIVAGVLVINSSFLAPKTVNEVYRRVLNIVKKDFK